MSGECDDCGNTMCVCSEVERQRQAARPTITVDLETLAIAVSDDHPDADAAREELEVMVAHRKGELNKPAPGPWRIDPGTHGLVDADGNHLTYRDLDRALMAPALAEALRRILEFTHKEHPGLWGGPERVLARFDNPEGSE